MSEKRKEKKRKASPSIPDDVAALMERLSRRLPARDLGKSCPFMENAGFYSWNVDREKGRRVEVGCRWRDGKADWMICLADSRRCQHMELSTRDVLVLNEKIARVMQMCSSDE